MQKHVKTAARHAKHHAVHFIRRHPRGWKVLLTVLFINIMFIGMLFINTRVYPNTYLLAEPIGYTSFANAQRIGDHWLATPYKIRVKERTYTYSYTDLGVTVDKEKLLAELRAPNTLPFPQNMFALNASPFRKRIITPKLVFTQQFRQFVHDTIFDFTEIDPSIDIDQATKSLLIEGADERYRFDEQKLKNLLIERLGNNSIPLYPALTKVQSERLATIVDFANKLATVYATPLTVYANAGGRVHSIFLTEEALKAITTIDLAPAGNDIVLAADEGILNQALTNTLKRQGFILKGTITNPKVKEDFVDVMRARFFGATDEALSIALDQGPNTTGRQAAKYIEVDISQQMLYTWKNGKLVKSYHASTGLDYPTPIGTFTVLNKTGLGFSNIYDSWLPYWMGFSYSKELGAYFGIHEQPYTLDESGRQIRQKDFIGRPNTGGCVALAPGAALEVYRFADIGTRIYIFQ